MKRGFKKNEIKEIERKIAIIHGSFDTLINEIKDKMNEAEEWVDDRSEKWQESEKAEEFEDWISELDSKLDELENLKNEVSIDLIEEIL